jgi:hypothetical protein
VSWRRTVVPSLREGDALWRAGIGAPGGDRG